MGQLAGFIRCVLTWVGEKVNPHHRFIAYFVSKKNCIKSKGGILEKISFVLYVGQLAEFTRCVMTWLRQKVKPYNRFKAFINIKHCVKSKDFVFSLQNKLCII